MQENAAARNAAIVRSNGGRRPRTRTRVPSAAAHHRLQRRRSTFDYIPALRNVSRGDDGPCAERGGAQRATTNNNLMLARVSALGCLVLSAAAVPREGSQHAGGANMSVLEIASAVPQLSTLVRALKAANLTDARVMSQT